MVRLPWGLWLLVLEKLKNPCLLQYDSSVRNPPLTNRGERRRLGLVASWHFELFCKTKLICRQRKVTLQTFQTLEEIKFKVVETI